MISPSYPHPIPINCTSCQDHAASRYIFTCLSKAGHGNRTRKNPEKIDGKLMKKSMTFGVTRLSKMDDS